MFETIRGSRSQNRERAAELVFLPPIKASFRPGTIAADERRSRSATGRWAGISLTRRQVASGHSTFVDVLMERAIDPHRFFMRSIRYFVVVRLPMIDLVDIVIPASAQAAAEALGLKVSRSVTSGVRIRQIPREDAEIALECLRDWGFAVRIIETAAEGESASEGDLKPAA